MPAYVLANMEVSNPEGYQEYVRQNTAVVEKHGGRFVVRGGKVEVLEGEWPTYRVVLIEFPDGEAARRWYNSPEYQAIRTIRLASINSGYLAIFETP